MIHGGEGGKEEKRKEGMEGEKQGAGCSNKKTITVISQGEDFRNKWTD